MPPRAAASASAPPPGSASAPPPGSAPSQPAPRLAPALVLVLALGLALGLAGCGGGGRSLDVSAAASLQPPFEHYGAALHARYSFGGSDQLAAQIVEGVRPDVYAAANTALPDELYRRGLVSRPVVFATNRLVLAVPRGSRRVHAFADLQRPGVTIALGSTTVPVGAYADAALARLPWAEQARILANVRDREPDVNGIVGKLSQGAVDAGLLYATDVRAAGGSIVALPLPPGLAPPARYGVAVVRGGGDPAGARAFIAGLLRGAGARALRAAGFGLPPRP